MADMSPQAVDAGPGANGWYAGTIVPPMPGTMHLQRQ
jgi:hypothetical protein